MKHDRSKRLDANGPDPGCKILPFRLRDTVGASDTIEAHRRRPAKRTGPDIVQLLDLSRYENPNRHVDDFRSRMVENVAAIVLLSALVALAAYDLFDLQQIQHCASLGAC